MRLYRNRIAAAEELARHLSHLTAEHPIVLGLANGGVPLAEVIARSLEAPLDVLLLERLTAPGRPDQVVGVVDELGRISMIESSARWHHLSSQQMIGPAREAFRRIQRRRGKLRAVLPSVDVVNRTVVIVDQGVDTGARMLGAIASVRDRGARRIVVAAPVGASGATWQLHDTADLVVIPHQPTHYEGPENCYEDYTEVSDEIMVAILQKWVAAHPVDEPAVQTLVMKVTHPGGRILVCELDLPPGCTRRSGPYPAVLFAHGFESDARSPRSVPISQRLAKRSIIGVRLNFTGHGRSEGTVEEATEEQMMKDLRLVHQQVQTLHEVDPDSIGLNGSGTGAMLALRYAAFHPELKALVIRGPVCGDEAVAARHVKAPTLIIHAERDTALTASVETIDRELASTHQLLRIPDSSRLFNDPISLELMIDASVDWLADHMLTPQRQTTASAR
jgi:predicted phosphoribosyltransferase/dienelactone hydrolase